MTKKCTSKWIKADAEMENIIDQVLPVWRRLLVTHEDNYTQSYWGKSKKNPNYSSHLYLMDKGDMLQLNYCVTTNTLIVHYRRRGYLHSNCAKAVEERIERWNHEVVMYDLERVNSFIAEVYNMPPSPDNYRIEINMDEYVKVEWTKKDMS